MLHKTQKLTINTIKNTKINTVARVWAISLHGYKIYGFLIYLQRMHKNKSTSIQFGPIEH